MIKIIEWSTNWEGDEQIKGKYLVFFDRFSVAKGKWKGFMFDIQGLGVSKVEKELGLPSRKHVAVYFLRWYFTYDREGYKNMGNVIITNEKVLI